MRMVLSAGTEAFFSSCSNVAGAECTVPLQMFRGGRRNKNESIFRTAILSPIPIHPSWCKHQLPVMPLRSHIESCQSYPFPQRFPCHLSFFSSCHTMPAPTFPHSLDHPEIRILTCNSSQRTSSCSSKRSVESFREYLRPPTTMGRNRGSTRTS